MPALPIGFSVTVGILTGVSKLLNTTNISPLSSYINFSGIIAAAV